jgi:hypothetical protein
MNELKLQGCWLVNINSHKNGYSIPVYVDYLANEEEVIDICFDKALFECAEDYFYANAEQMDENDFNHFKEQIIILT